MQYNIYEMKILVSIIKKLIINIEYEYLFISI